MSVFRCNCRYSNFPDGKSRDLVKLVARTGGITRISRADTASFNARFNRRNAFVISWKREKPRLPKQRFLIFRRCRRTIYVDFLNIYRTVWFQSYKENRWWKFSKREITVWQTVCALPLLPKLLLHVSSRQSLENFEFHKYSLLRARSPANRFSPYNDKLIIYTYKSKRKIDDRLDSISN